jgi:hypothetical protein
MFVCLSWTATSSLGRLELLFTPFWKEDLRPYMSTNGGRWVVASPCEIRSRRKAVSGNNVKNISNGDKFRFGGVTQAMKSRPGRPGSNRGRESSLEEENYSWYSLPPIGRGMISRGNGKKEREMRIGKGRNSRQWRHKRGETS